MKNAIIVADFEIPAESGLAWVFGRFGTVKKLQLFINFHFA